MAQGSVFWSAPRSTTVQMGAMSGGGYMKDIDLSPDGLTRLMTYDSGAAFIWDFSASRWANILSQDRLPVAYQNWGQQANLAYMFTAYSLVCAPSRSQRLYMVLFSNPGGGGNTPGLVWKSDNRGEKWTDTGFRLPATLPSTRGFGPLMAVDPANQDVVYVSSIGGAVFRTTDGFVANFECLNRTGGVLEGVLIGANSSATDTSGTTLHFASSPAGVPQSGFAVWATDVDRPLALPSAFQATAAGATTVTVSVAIPASPGVQSGDLITFGNCACIVFDPASGTTGGRTNGIYIGWGYGATAVYHSTNAGVSFAATTGGPAQVKRLNCSSDGHLYACDFTTGTAASNTTNAWGYDGATWTNFTAAPAPSGNNWNSCSSDPGNPGRVVFQVLSGGFQVSGDYGATWYSSIASQPIRSASDVPWLATTLEGRPGAASYQTNGAVVYDPATPGLAWTVEGIGAWTWTPPVQASPPASQGMSSVNIGQQSLIVDQILKPPGQPLLAAVQDRMCLQLVSLTDEPANDCGLSQSTGIIGSGWGIDYAKSDPTYIALLVGQNIYVSTSSGAYNTFVKKTAQVPGANNGGCVAVQTTTNMVWFPANNGTPGYTTDGGDSWSSCLFDGSTISTGWNNSLFNNRHIVCCDYVDSNTYYAYNFTNGANGGLWRSTDGGANWTNMSGGISNLPPTASVDVQLVAVPGNQGHLFYANGSQFNTSKQLFRSVDAGATWQLVTSTGIAWQVAPGLAGAGQNYPAIFMTGTIAGDSQMGVFRADGFTGDTAVMPTWTRLCYAPGKNMSPSKTLCGDLETYGRFYLGTGSVGYSYGTLVA